MKKNIFFILILIIFSIFPLNIYADVIGEVLNTDITAYVDGVPIRSYNIDGWTGIVAEDLREYGFDVDWFEDERALYISRYDKGKITADYKLEENKKEIGSHLADIYSTDIKTYINGEEIQSFNIDGRTIIYIDYLQCYGDVMWYPTERKICYEYEAPWKIKLESYYEGDTQKNIDSFKISVLKDDKGEYEVNGMNLQYLDNLYVSHSKADGMKFSVSLYQRVLFQTEELSNLLWKTITIKYGDEEIQKNADMANELMKIYINGELIHIKDVDYGRGNGHTDYYFVLDTDITKEEINTIEINFN